MSSFFDEIAAKLAQLSGVATPEVSRDELNEFNVRDIQAVRVSEGGGGGGGNVPFVGVDPPDSPTDGMLWWDPDDDTPAPTGGFQAVGCVIHPVADIDVVAANPAYFTFDADLIHSDISGNTTLAVLPDGIGIDQAGMGTDTLTFTEDGIWAFSLDAIGIVDQDATWEGQLIFGNMQYSDLLNIPVASVLRPSLVPSAVWPIASGQQFNIGIATSTPATAMTLAASFAALSIVRLA